MKIRSLVSSLVLVAGIFLAATASASQKSDIERQRELFRAVFADVERGNWSAVEQLAVADQQLLQRYVLWPDLRATWLKANIRRVSDVEVDTFLLKYATLKPARELRYRYALNKVRDGDLAGYLTIYEQFYQGQDIAKLDCLALQAELKAGRYTRVDRRALDLWMVGKSQVKECDPVFAYLDKQNLLGLLQYQERYALAIEAREFSLARWLGKQIDSQHVSIATEWRKAQSDPEDFLRRKRSAADNATLREQLVYAAERLTYRDPELAATLWKKVSKRYAFSESQKMLTLQHIALWTARDNLPGAYKKLISLPAPAQSEEVLRWRARVSLRNGNWRDVLRDIGAMSAEERNSEEWRYWQSYSLNKTRQPLAAQPLLESLSNERSYYGFLAADDLEKDYPLSPTGLAPDEAIIARVASKPAVVRARELYFVGQDGRGRSEWDAAIRYLSDDEKLQAAILANRWGWHSRAIATAASLGEYDDLNLRYPLPFREAFERSSTDASIATTWAYGIARSESLFMRDVRSHAGAIGLMQLMPATGREVAKEIKLSYSGLATLTNPDANIRLGTTYLGMMAERYDGNRIPATAAYNAGPHRVDRWLPESGGIDARIWIENIPFNETRAYVKRVLAAQTIFHWRMNGDVKRLSADLARVEARSERLAAN
ncbi:MAG: transglycosylase SLT domain-containing protein [Pseudomonadota bacterium]